MAWSVWVCDTVSGAKLQRLPVAAFSWSRVLNGSGSGSATVKLNDAAVKKLNARTLTNPVSNTLVLDWDGVVVYAGVIWSRDYNREGTSLTLGHADIWSILSRRFAVNHYESPIELWKTTYTGISLQQFAKNLMILVFTGTRTRTQCCRSLCRLTVRARSNAPCTGITWGTLWMRSRM